MRLGDLEATHVVTYGSPGDMPIVGKWTGDGLDRIGVFRAGQWFLTQTVTDQPQAAYSFAFGGAGDKPVVGDWNNNGTETVGVYRPANGSGTFYLRNSLSTGFADRTITLNFGQSAEAVPVAGRWSSSVGYGVGIVENGVFKLVNLPASGSTLTFTAPTYTETFGSALDKPFVFMGAHHIPAVFRDSRFSIKPESSSTGCTSPSLFGVASDVPLAGKWQIISTPTPTPTMVPGTCQVVITQGKQLEAYADMRSAAVADLSNGFAGIIQAGNVVEVYSRSELHESITEIGIASLPQQRFWADTGDGRVSLVSGSCGLLTPKLLDPPITNPIQRPAPWTMYPLRVANPQSVIFYQFAIANTRYTTTARHHPGIDFFVGSLDQPQAGIDVVSVADGTVLAYCTNNQIFSSMQAVPSWLGGVSPTDCPGSRAFVVVRYGNVIVLYAHLDVDLRLQYPSGLSAWHVVAGQPLGKIANSSDTHDAHLHFKVRNYSFGDFDIGQLPRYWINGWQYFNPTVQSIIDQNWENRKALDQQVTKKPGLQTTQCFSSPENPPLPELPSGIRVYGIAPNDPSMDRYRAFRWVANNSVQELQLDPLPTPWQVYCLPN
jgi:murein DD-endopeptidase MepM/ murein hydrolase activator NlpD